MSNKNSFKNNTAYSKGGAIYLSGAKLININNSIFEDNSSTNESGGCIYIDKNSDENI